MNTIKFRIAAKTDVGLVRTNNEDNFQASSDLSGGQMRWVNNEICSLGEKGALIVVADGMGGMNAGEVASELAIDTIRDYFNPAKITSEVIKNRFSIEKYMNDAIVAADARIKAEAKLRPETKGMGTTIVVGWILGGKLYISWCGDSRAYVYNPLAGLHQISKDHSYVQNLVDKGSITREEAFDFPDSNIITRCLSDGSVKAKPESLLKPYDICDNDIIMLCTDGLSGMIRDEEIESIIKSNEHNMDTLVDELIKSACEAEGSDNITICLCQILQGGGICNPVVFNDYDKRLNGNKDNFIRTFINKPEEIAPHNRFFWYIGLTCIAIAIICGAIWWFMFRNSSIEDNQNNVNIEEIRVDNMEDGTTVVNQPKVEPSDDRHDDFNDKKEATKDSESTNTRGTIFQSNDGSNVSEGEESEDDQLTPINTDDVNTDDGISVDDSDDEITEIRTTEYEVQKGDTYWSISRNFNTSVEVLKQLNNSIELRAGTKIKVPQKK